ncbi:MAG: hypothetical protein CMO81_06100 [Waddliaceae bacterium]|nr:hypothetical protein [Waddliaceae bacterium]
MSHSVPFDGQSLIQEIPNFLDHVFDHLKEEGINTDRYFIDHLCYRSASEEDYQALQSAFASVAKKIHEALVGGRMISIFTFHEPILYRGHKITLFELPAPKPGREEINAWEHLEFVIDEDLYSFQTKYPNTVFDTKNLNRVENPDLTLHFPNTMVRFHLESLHDIVMREKEQG